MHFYSYLYNVIEGDGLLKCKGQLKAFYEHNRF